MSTKIQINSLEALERLIGGDSETEIEIRNSIVQEFTKKHLKAVTTSEAMEMLKTTLVRQIEEDLYDKVSHTCRPEFKFKPEVAARLDSEIKGHVVMTIEKMVREHIRLTKVEERINKCVDDAVLWVESSLKEALLAKKIEQWVDQRIKEKLGIK